MNLNQRFDSDVIRQDIAARWDVFDYPKLWPWLRRPCTVRILFYADGGVRYDGGSFLGLKHVLATLAADPWYWVRFQVTKAHRGADPSADQENVDLSAIDLSKYDEIWFYSINSTPYSAAEVAAVSAFMDSGGGVLVTGDHANLGAALGTIPRAGKMRLLPAPPAAPPVWNTTLREGPDPGATFDFADQSDDVPQKLRLRQYPIGLFRTRPHPVMCGPDGPIDVLPDHQHEGEAVAPAVLPAAEWPTSGSGFQPRPEVIAWGSVIDPAADKFGQEIGVVSAYNGHLADGKGRIVADATWHHHFDINLLGLPGNPTYQGFPASADGMAALKKIEAYFLNIGVWLAPKAKQACMRNRACWGLLWREQLVELTPELPLHVLGGEAIDALGKVAPQCTAYDWYLDLLPLKVRLLVEELPVGPGPDPEMVQRLVMGAAVATLLERFGRSEERSEPPAQAPSDDELDKVFAGAVAVGIKEEVARCRAVARGAEALGAALESGS